MRVRNYDEIVKRERFEKCVSDERQVEAEVEAEVRHYPNVRLCRVISYTLIANV